MARLKHLGLKVSRETREGLRLESRLRGVGVSELLRPRIEAWLEELRDESRHNGWKAAPGPIRPGE